MKKVLIVEDEGPIRKVMADMLTDSKFIVSEAHDGAEGLSKALNERPDVILLDLLMPKMSGHSMLKALRKDPWGKNAKVIVLSNQDDPDNIGKSYYDGRVTEYILKSNVSLNELKKQVKAAIVIAS